MGKQIIYKETDVLEAIDGTGAILSTVADRLKCSWSTARKAVNSFPEAREKMESELQMTLDEAESALHIAIENGNIDAAKWYLTKKGRSRGYGDLLSFGMAEDSGPLEFVIAQDNSDANFLSGVVKKS